MRTLRKTVKSRTISCCRRLNIEVRRSTGLKSDQTKCCALFLQREHGSINLLTGLPTGSVDDLTDEVEVRVMLSSAQRISFAR
jgi:hypothetical protein